jgi:hypothetical protein
MAHHEHDQFLLDTCRILAADLVKNHTFPRAQCEDKTFDSGYYGIVIHVPWNYEDRKLFWTLDQGYIGLEDHQIGKLYLGIQQLNLFKSVFDSKNEIQFPHTEGRGRYFGDVNPQLDAVNNNSIHDFARLVHQRIYHSK